MAELPSLDGLRLRAVHTGALGEIGRDTLFQFSQQGSMVSARYAGGTVALGFLVGTLRMGGLVFRYCQVDRRGEVHGGHSMCEVTRLPNGCIRVVEHFQWDSRQGSGTNVLEEVPADTGSGGGAPCT